MKSWLTGGTAGYFAYYLSGVPAILLGSHSNPAISSSRWMNTYPSEGYQSHHNCRGIGSNGSDHPLHFFCKFLPRNHEVL